jgi:hypothetical protein
MPFLAGCTADRRPLSLTNPLTRRELDKAERWAKQSGPPPGYPFGESLEEGMIGKIPFGTYINFHFAPGSLRRELMDRSPARFSGQKNHGKNSPGSRLAFFEVGFWLLGLFGLLGVPGEMVCPAQEPPAAFQQLQRRWPNGPFQDPKQFPIAVWLQDPRNAGRYKEIGIALYVGLWKGPTEAQLAELRRHQMPVICEQNDYALAHREEKLIVGWLQDDEPDNAQPLPGGKGYGPPVPPEKVVQRYQEIRRRDPSRPVLLNLGQAVAWDDWHGRGVRSRHPEDYPLYVQGGDIVSFDIYPVVHPKPAVAGKLWYVPRGVQRLRQWAGPDRVVWNCIETTRISNLQVKPTPQQVKAEVWMSLIFGSQGIIYFCHQFKPQFVEAALLADREMAEAVGQLNRQIHQLAPVLWTPDRRDLVAVAVQPAEVDEEMARLLGATPIAWTAKVYENNMYIFAVRMQPTPVQAQFRLRAPLGADGVQVLVLGENRRLPIQNGAFQDRFGPYEVHLYEITLRASPPTTSPEAEAVQPESTSGRKPENLPPPDGSGKSAPSSSSVAGRSEREKPVSPEEQPTLPPMEFHPEMSYSVGPDGWIMRNKWTDDQITQAAKGQQEAQALWQKLAPRYAKWVTPEKVRELSRWAQNQMAGYRSVPPLEKTVLEPTGLSPEGRLLVLEGTIDTLPSHHRLVTRWLKVYVHYDLSAKKIVRVVFTIRGQLEE